jgi:hypothetical protein
MKKKKKLTLHYFVHLVTTNYTLKEEKNCALSILPINISNPIK